MPVNMNELQNSFFEEAAEHLGNMEIGLLQLEEKPEDPTPLNGVFRAAHSIKGASGLFGLTEMATFTHSLENLLDRLRSGQMTPTRALVDLLLRSSDVLRGLVQSAQDGSPSPPHVAEVLQELKQSLGETVSHPAETVIAAISPSQVMSCDYRVRFHPQESFLREGMDPLLLLRNLARAGELLEVQADFSHLPALAELNPESCWLDWTLVVRTQGTQEDIQDVFRFVEGEDVVRVEPVSPRGTGGFASPNPTRDLLLLQAEFLRFLATFSTDRLPLLRAAIS